MFESFFAYWFDYRLNGKSYIKLMFFTEIKIDSIYFSLKR